ncbi:MAG: response regulator [Prevotella sp.]|nr:response regulator [Prevotella sp.]
MKRIIKIITLGLCLFSAQRTTAAEARFYTSEQLSSSSVRDICQDRYGFIWIGTELGLNRFDGYHFVNFFHNRRNSLSITDNQVNSFLTDREGRFWIGFGKGAARYDYPTERFIRCRFPRDIEPRVNAIVQNHQGDIFFGTAGYGLYMLPHGQQDGVLTGVEGTDPFITHLFIDPKGRLFCSTPDAGFDIYSVKEGKLSARRHIDTPCGTPVAFVQRDARTLLVVCQRGILSYDNKTGIVGRAPYSFPVEGEVMISSATICRDGSLLIGTSGHGMIRFDKGSYAGRQEKLMAGTRSLSTASVNSILEDKDRNLWLCCANKGVLLTTQQKPLFDSWSFSQQGRSLAKRIASITDDGAGGAWCAVWQDNIYHLGADGTITPSPHPAVAPSLLYRDPSGQYWMGADNTLYRYSPQTGKVLHEKTFEGAEIGCITIGANGLLYVSVFGNGFYEYDTHSRQARLFNMNTESPTGKLNNDWVSHMLVDRKGMLWLSTSYGLSCMDTRTHRFNALGFDILLRGISCGPLCEMPNGDIVVGTNDGLYRYDRKENKIQPFPGAEVMDNKAFCAIVCDKQGDLWISTSRGIWHYKQKEKTFISHINGNGLVTGEYTNGAVIQYADGHIAFGHGDGITIFQPAQVKNADRLLPPVQLTRFLPPHFSFLLPPSTFHIPHSSFLIPHSSISLPHDENTFTIELSLLNYRNADHINFQYRINDGQWISTGEGINTITFNKMKPGNYRIEVRAEENGNYSTENYILNVCINAPWYLTIWAYIVYALLAIAIAVLVFRSYSRRKKAELDEEKMRFLMNATHDIRSPLTLIMAPLKKLKNGKQEDFLPAIETIEHNANRLMLLVNQILDERKIDKNLMQIHCSETNLADFINGVCQLYLYNAQQRNITFTCEHPEEPITAWIDRIQFDKVISNLLSNAFKYTSDGGTITIRLSETSNNIIISVTDTGEGFKEEKTDRLFERFYQGKTSEMKGIQGTGIGLNLARSIVLLHGGKIVAANRKDGQQGAVFTITLPQGNSHLKPEQIVEQPSPSPHSSFHTPHSSFHTPHSSFHTPHSSFHTPHSIIRIMVVDDDKDLADYLIAELSPWYKFFYQPNGKEALKELLTQPGMYDLVISDVMMPEMDGITLLKRIKQNPNISELPVILLTSKSEIENRLEGLRYGADAYIPKPFNLEEVHLQIDNLIDNVRRMRGKFSGAQQQEDKVEQVEMKSNDEALMERVMRSVNKNMGNADFNVDQLAQDVGLSRAQLHRKMKEITGLSTGKFIRNIRMDQAAKLIKQGHVNIAQVAYSVGFNEQAHFSTVFKTYYGMTPTEYAEKHKEE